MHRARLSVCIFVVLSACSTASYQQPVSQLADGVSKVKTSFQDILAQYKQAVAQDRAVLLLAPGAQLRPPGACEFALDGPASPGVNDCVWQITVPGQPVRSVIDTSPVPNAEHLVTLLDSYASALATLAAAKDVDEEKAAIAKATASISTLASAVYPPAAPAIGAAFEAASFLAQKAADYRRLRQLREVVDMADPVIQQAVGLLTKEIRFLKSAVVAGRRNMLIETIDHPVSSKRNEALAAREITVSDIYDLESFERADAAAPLAKMGKAHAALKQALDSPNASLTDAIQEASDFVAEAGKLASMVRAPTSTPVKGATK